MAKKTQHTDAPAQSTPAPNNRGPKPGLYRVGSQPIHEDGRNYDAGAEIALDPKRAQALGPLVSPAGEASGE